jgi:hypothetical protein
MARPKCGACPLRERCAYFRSGGVKEKVALSKSIIPTPPSGGANPKPTINRALLFLHEAHRKYFSAHPKRYEPFRLPKGVVTRAAIKAHFRESHGLELSVRPPHGDVLIGGKPTLLINAQILLGSPRFPAFPKESAVKWMKRYVKNAILEPRKQGEKF